MIRNANIIEWAYSFWPFPETSRIEIVSNDDPKAKNLKSLTSKVAEIITEKHPSLKIFRVYKTNGPWNYNHPFFGACPKVM